MSTRTSCVHVGDETETLANAARFVYAIANDAEYSREESSSTSKKCDEHAEEVLKMPLSGALMEKLMEKSEKVFADAKESDVETLFIVAATLVERLSDAKERKEAHEMISEKAAASATAKVELRLRILMQLYNLARDLEIKLALFCKIIDFVKKARMENVIETLVQHTEESMNDWKRIDNGDGSAREVYLEISKLLKGMSGQEERSIEFALRYLTMYENATDKSKLAESSEVAKEAIASFIRLPTNSNCDFLDYKAVQALESGKDAKVFELIEIFLTKDVADYMSFVKGNRAVLKELGLNEDDTLTKMRLMTLAGVKSGSKISYKDICERLQIDASECEDWIVQGISSGLLEAKMDQVRELCIITQSTQRIFVSSLVSAPPCVSHMC